MPSEHNSADSCPDREVLEAVLKGGLAESRLKTIEAHLESCAACQGMLEELSGSAAFDRAMLAESSTNEYTNDTVTNLTEVLKTYGRFVLDDSGSKASEALKFLTPATDLTSIGTLGSYQIIEEVARGGMGVVLKAFDPNLHRNVAIKVLAPALAANSEAHRRFMREARAAAALDHENILPIYAVEPAKPLPYLVAPFVDGPSLQQWIDEHGPLTNDQIVAVASKIADGLQEAHRAGVIHRDLKPANILTESELERVWITDFGLARLGVDQRITQTSCLSGTPQFMAPEQVNGETVDHRADLFALGATLYAMATGRPPFQGESMAATLHQVVNTAPTPPRVHNDKLHPDLDRAILRLLEKDPKDRFQSGDEVKQCLANLGKTDANDRRRVLKLLTLAACLLVTGIIAWFLSPNRSAFVNTSQGVAHGTISEAVAEAVDGDVLEIRANGKLELDSVAIGERTLTIRAAKGFAPILTKADNSESPLISSSGRLWLEGLAFHLENPAHINHPIVEIDSGMLRMNNCRLTMTFPGEVSSAASACVIAKNAENIEISNCEVFAPSLTFLENITTEALQGQRIQLINNMMLVSQCLTFANPEQSVFNIELRRNVLIAETCVASHPDQGDVQLRVYSLQNLLAAEQALFHMPAATDVQRLSWIGTENIYAISRWYVHGYLKRGQRYAEVSEFERWLGHVNEESAIEAAEIDRDDILKLGENRFSGQRIMNWLANQKSLTPGLPYIGYQLDFAGPTDGLDRWKRTDEGKAWRTSASLGAKKAP